MIVSIPDEVLAKIHFNKVDFRVEIAAYLYEKHRLSMGKARKVAGINQIAFQKELQKRDIYIHFETSDLDNDINNLKSL